MAAWDYTAVDSAGQISTGTVTAADERGAHVALARRDLLPLRLARSLQATGEPSASAARGTRMSARDLALTTRQLATLVGVSPVEEALRTIAMQSERPKVRRLLLSVHAGVLEGYRLSEAMGRQAAAFPALYRAMVGAGESSGSLAAILQRLADLLEREQQVRGKVMTALVYPMVLAVVALGVIGALMVFVVPKVVEQFESLNQALPLLTRLVIGASDLLVDWGLVLAVTLAALIGAGLLALRRPAFKLRFDTLTLAAPLIGRLSRDLHAARLARTLSTLIASGVPVLEGLTITARTVANTRLRAATLIMADAVREGGSLSAAMRRADVFPPILVYMTASGESSGQLEPMMERAAQYLEREFETFTAVMLSLLEPAIIVLMGGVVAVIVLSILLPILQINTLAMG